MKNKKSTLMGAFLLLDQQILSKIEIIILKQAFFLQLLIK